MAPFTSYGLILRVAFSVFGAWLIARLLSADLERNYRAGLFIALVILVVWLFAPETAGRIKLLGVELDNRIQSATQLIARLQKLEATARQTADTLKEEQERESLREFAMLTMGGERALGGGIFVLAGDFTRLHGHVFHAVRVGSLGWKCSAKGLAMLGRLTGAFPSVPYGYMARAVCLQQRGDSAWKADAERCEQFAAKIKSIQPHVDDYDSVYDRCHKMLADG